MTRFTFPTGKTRNRKNITKLSAYKYIIYKIAYWSLWIWDELSEDDFSPLQPCPGAAFKERICLFGLKAGKTGAGAPAGGNHCRSTAENTTECHTPAQTAPAFHTSLLEGAGLEMWDKFQSAASLCFFLCELIWMMSEDGWLLFGRKFVQELYCRNNRKYT